MLCFDLAVDAREFMYRVSDNGMATDEYVYLILSMKSTGFGQVADMSIKCGFLSPPPQDMGMESFQCRVVCLPSGSTP